MKSVSRMTDINLDSVKDVARGDRMFGFLWKYTCTWKNVHLE